MNNYTNNLVNSQKENLMVINDVMKEEKSHLIVYRDKKINKTVSVFSKKTIEEDITKIKSIRSTEVDLEDSLNALCLSYINDQNISYDETSDELYTSKLDQLLKDKMSFVAFYSCGDEILVDVEIDEEFFVLEKNKDILEALDKLEDFASSHL